MALRPLHRRRTTLTSLALLLCSATAFAGPHQHHRGHAGGLFARLDQNGDGKIEQAEARSAAATHFAQVDENGDGTLTRDERKDQASPQRPAKRGGEHFARMDQNKDGKLDRTETKMPEVAFTAADENKDGKLTPKELEAAFEKRVEVRRAARFAQLDTNKDGKVTKAEALAHADRRFAALDANKDGQVTRKEAHAARAAKRPGRGHATHDCGDAAGHSRKGGEKPARGQAI